MISTIGQDYWGPPQVWGCECQSCIFRVFCLTRGGRVAWIVRLVQIGADGDEPFADVMTINRPDGLDDIANLGLTVADGKQVLAASNRRLLPPKPGTTRFGGQSAEPVVAFVT